MGDVVETKHHAQTESTETTGRYGWQHLLFQLMTNINTIMCHFLIHYLKTDLDIEQFCHATILALL